ncbi:MAG TPA: ATP-dependent sacrificial sulfur transferase LarE [Bacillota bacterium]|nr:ATP-dependent sacrificial sulfur transferase LarE [Bacillota bacterium]
MPTKLEQLQNLIKEYGSCLVAFSGGVDSSLLLKVAHQVLGGKVLAVTAASQIRPDIDLRCAERIAASVGVPLDILDCTELADPVFSANSPTRCYHCKKVLYSRLLRIAKEKGYAVVLDGANGEDSLDFRPGLRAAWELGIKSPLAEVDLSKAEIRSLAREMGLVNWDRPSSPCLASRFPYGETLTAAKIRQVALAEEYLTSLGFTEFRVRHHGTLARLELEQQYLSDLIGPLRENLLSYLKKLGFTYITVDLSGFRSGSMNEVLPKEVQNGSKQA